jgi:hypothetical protein
MVKRIRSTQSTKLDVHWTLPNNLVSTKSTTATDANSNQQWTQALDDKRKKTSTTQGASSNSASKSIMANMIEETSSQSYRLTRSQPCSTSIRIIRHAKYEQQLDVHLVTYPPQTVVLKGFESSNANSLSNSHKYDPSKSCRDKETSTPVSDEAWSTTTVRNAFKRKKNKSHFEVHPTKLAPTQRPPQPPRNGDPHNGDPRNGEVPPDR